MTTKDLRLAGVILPCGSIDPAGSSFVGDDVELVQIEFRAISPDPSIQRRYEALVVRGWPHVDAFVLTADHIAGLRLRKVPFRDDERIYFGRTHTPVKISDDIEVQIRYSTMLSRGESHKMAEMLATRSFPGVKTDAVFNEGKFSGDTGKIGPEQKWLEEQAKLHGISTNGKWYCRGLASFPGDPTAWVDGRGDVLRIAAEKNMTVKGYVEHKGHEVDPGNDEVIADDIIENEVEDILDSNPHANADEVRDAVYQLRTGAVDPNPLLVQD